MAAQRTYYEILGVSRGASLDEIKKRYRELARQHHPDVNQGKPEAAKRFTEITTAYKTLSHPDERAAYDADLALRERRAAQGAARAAANTFTGTSPAPPGRPAPPRSAAGTGRAAPGGTPPRTAAPPGSADTARLVAEAQAAFVRGKFVEARALCEQVLRRDRRSAAAYEILGDIYRLQGRTDEAINMYTMALQFNPRNHTVMQRLERLSRTGPGSAQQVFFDNRSRPSSARPHRPAHGPAPAAPERFMEEKRPLATLIGGMIGYGLTFLLILYVALIDKGRPFGANAVFAPIADWSWTLITVLLLTGLLLGFTLAATAAVRRIDDELILVGSRTGSLFLPLGLVMITVSVFSFYAAALLYGIVGFLQESFTVSMARVFGVVVAVVLLLTALYDPGRGQVFLFGGNVVFLALLIGWAIGDFFRPDGF